MIASDINYTRGENYPFSEQNNVQDKNIKYDVITSYIHVNSSDRDTSKYPKVNNYRINFDNVLKNVHSIEIVSASLANQGTPLSNPYLILGLDGLNHITFSNNSSKKGFSTLYLPQTTSAHILPDLDLSGGNIYFFKNPLSSLNQFDISIYTPGGTLFNFGEPDADTTVGYSNSFLFKVKTLVKSRNDLNNRAVF